jgi:hypothetical protein
VACELIWVACELMVWCVRLLRNLKKKKKKQKTKTEKEKKKKTKQPD